MKKEIHLNKFVPRDYQLCLFDALENKHYKRIFAVWPRRCLSGESHILLPDGSWKFLKDLKVGDKILSWDGHKFVPDKVKNKWSTGVKKTKKVQAYCFLPIVTSEDHRFASVTQYYDKFSWTRISDFKTQMQALNYAGLGGGCYHNPDLAEFIGYMSCDGYCSGYQQPKFTNTNQEILKRVEYLAKKLFNYDAIWRKKGNGYDLGFSNGTRGGGTFKNKVKELFRKYGQDVPKYKQRLISLVWEFDSESLSRFFAAAISSDGSIYAQKKGFVTDRNRIVPPGNEITISCGMSDAYGWDMYWLLRKVGIVPQVPHKERESNWKIRVSKGRDIKKLFTSGPIYGKQDKQAMILARLPKNPRSQTLLAGCFKNKLKISDHKEEELYDIETEKNHNFVANGYVVHNSGKDMTAYNICIRELLRKPQTIYYIFPTFASGRRILWDAISNDGFRILDYLPSELIESRNEMLMRIKLINGSVFQIIGSDTYDNTLVGTNPKGVVFSEFAISDPMAYSFVRPILSANGGWCIIISTPRGRNAMWDLYKIAKQSPAWFVSMLTVEDTKHIAIEDIMQERESGEMSEDLQMQEYWCSFDKGVEGSYYTKYIDRARLNGQIGLIPWESNYPVHTAWDLGVRDSTAILFFQVVGTSIRIIDSYEKNKEGLEHYINFLKTKPYTYGKHIAPHDIRVCEFASGNTRWEKARQLGVTFEVADRLSIEDGIEAVRSTFSKLYINAANCKNFIRAIENYRQEYDSKKKVYKPRPLHDSNSHFSDALRYLCISLPKMSDGMTAEDVDKNYRDAVYGQQSNIPSFFRDDNIRY